MSSNTNTLSRQQQQHDIASNANALKQRTGTANGTGLTVANIKCTKSAKRPCFILSNNNNSGLDEDSQPNILRNNRFAILDIEVLTVLSNTKGTKGAYTATTDNTNADIISNNNATTEDENGTSKLSDEINDNIAHHRFLPPIVMYDVNIKAFILELKTKVPFLIFKIKNCSNRKKKNYLLKTMMLIPK